MGWNKNNSDIFDILILLARPAAGKSEVIDFLKKTSADRRRTQFHIGRIHEIDDFPMLWTWFEEDSILKELGHPALHTDDEGYFKHVYLWDVLIRRIGLEYEKFLRDSEDQAEGDLAVAADSAASTVLVEFSRGSEHGGYARAFRHLDRTLLKRSAVLYIDVSYEESVRKNSRRFNPTKPDSILEHGLPPDKMERLYTEIDWEEFSGSDPEYLSIATSREDILGADISGADKLQVPYVVMPNHDDVTTKGGEALSERLRDALDVLWDRYSA